MRAPGHWLVWVLAGQHDDARALRSVRRRGVQDRRRELARGHATGPHGRRSRGRGGGTWGVRSTRRARGDAARATGATRAAVMHHRGVVVVMLVVVAVMAAVAKDEAGEEDDRDDEHDPGDDGDPRGELEDPRGPVSRRRLSGRRSCGGGPHGGVFRCFTHETNDEGVHNSCCYALLM